MTRRIALAVMALVTVLLVLAVVPLGLSLSSRERTAFRDNVEAADRARPALRLLVRGRPARHTAVRAAFLRIAKAQEHHKYSQYTYHGLPLPTSA